MDGSIILVVIVLLCFFIVIFIITILNRFGENKRNIESDRYKKEMDKLKEQLRRKEISKENYEKLRRNLEEEHQKIISQILRWSGY